MTRREVDASARLDMVVLFLDGNCGETELTTPPTVVRA
jgi:hypothetical protein